MLQLQRHAFTLRMLTAGPMVVLLACAFASAADGQDDSSGVAISLDGHYRVGCWTGVRHGQSASINVIETLDGDGAPVKYQQQRAVDGDAWSYVVPGSEAAPLILRSDDRVVLQTRFPTVGSPTRGPAMIPTSMPWVVVVGDALGVDAIGQNKLLNRDSRIAVSKPTTAQQFPDSVLGYDGVDLMLLGASSIDVLSSIDTVQQQAIVDWITGGGRVLLTLGAAAPQLLEAAPWIQALLPIEEVAISKLDPSALETFTASQTPLNPFDGIRLPKDQGRALVTGRTTRRVTAPIIVEYIVGFGKVIVVAADLEREEFAQWPERLDLVTAVTGDILAGKSNEDTDQNRSTGYRDLAGQMRSTLDQFSINRRVGFSVVSLILMALIAAIGPLDYLLVNRLFGRPLLGWLSFPLMVIGLSVVLALQARPSNDESFDANADSTTLDSQSERLVFNRFEVFDLDAVRQVGRGFSSTYVYTHEAQRLDFEVTPSASLQSISDSVSSAVTAPLGYPGESYGGIQFGIEDMRLPAYEVSFTGSPQSIATTLRGVPLAARSSKGLATRVRFTPEFNSDVAVTRRRGSQLLRGELVNPISLDILDGMLVYRNWTYLLPTRFPIGGRITAVDSLRQKNFRWRLSRQKALEESGTETEKWDPTATNSLVRVAEMLMFHNAAGGSRYTKLRNEPLSFLDLSHTLSDDLCVLVGRLANPLTEIASTEGGDAIRQANDTLTYVRILLPVKESRRR